MEKTKTVEINEKKYLIKDLGGSLKARLSASKSETLYSMMGDIEDVDREDKKAFAIALSKATAKQYKSKEFVEFVKEVTIAAVKDPAWDSDTWEIHFGNHHGNLRTLFDEIVDFNLSEGDKKKDDSEESETTSTSD